MLQLPRGVDKLLYTLPHFGTTVANLLRWSAAGSYNFAPGSSSSILLHGLQCTVHANVCNATNGDLSRLSRSLFGKGALYKASSMAGGQGVAGDSSSVNNPRKRVVVAVLLAAHVPARLRGLLFAAHRTCSSATLRRSDGQLISDQLRTSSCWHAVVMMACIPAAAIALAREAACRARRTYATSAGSALQSL